MGKEKSKEVEINGKKLSCMFCGNSEFIHIATAMNKRALSLLDAEALNLFTRRGLGEAYICTKCGLKHEFFEDVPFSKRSVRISDIEIS